MARPRRKPIPKGSPRSERTRRDNARARRLGYKSYYDYRLHGSGRVAPGPLRLSPAERARLRGHRGRADYLRALGEGDLILLPQGLGSVEFDPDARGGEGAYVELTVVVIDAATGQEREYTIRNLTRAEMEAMIERQQDSGAIFSPAPSLDIRRLLGDDDLEEREAA